MSSLPNINCYDIGWEFGGELLVLGMGHGASVIERARFACETQDAATGLHYGSRGGWTRSFTQ